jgi:hypothetical protein
MLEVKKTPFEPSRGRLWTSQLGEQREAHIEALLLGLSSAGCQ